MDCGTSLAKYTLFLFNTLVSVIGVLTIFYGVLLLDSIGMVQVNGQVGFPPQAMLPIALISLGSTVVFIAFLGCCGAIRESVGMTLTYAVFMLMLLIVQTIMIVLLWTNKDKFRAAMGEIIERLWADPETRDRGIFDALQQSLKCCGVNSIADYALIGKMPPDSCCEGNCSSLLDIKYSGCRGKFQDLMTGGSENAKYFALGLIVVELLGFIFACCVANNVRNYKRRNAY